ncbi:MAG: hypothetical protein ACRD1H_13135, partial [Vicinamibacterales bacterium]
LGPLEPGSHTIRIEVDSALTSPDLRGEGATVGTITFEHMAEAAPTHTAVSMAPFVYARPNTVGRFTDLPVFMWYELEPTPRGTRYRYSMIFTNEDGGTPTDRLMATWGRTTDIEYLYSVEVDRKGVIVAEDFQGPDHEVLPFAGTREGRHPLLWVSTENNMVLDRGTTRVRYAPAPAAFPLRDVSREAVMDRHPWLYAVMSKELIREGKIVPDAAPGTDTISDPRRFVYLEACGELGGAALAFAILVEGGTERETEGGTEGGTLVPPNRKGIPPKGNGIPPGRKGLPPGPQWIASDRGVRDYRIVRDGCFRAAIPLPASLGARDVRAVRAQAYARPPSADAPPTPAGSVRLTRLNTVFMLDERYNPGASRFEWQGSLTLAPDGPPVEIPVR